MLRQPPPEHCPGTDSKTAGSAAACQGCPNQSVCQAEERAPDPELPSLFAKIKESINCCVMVLSGKGGVGKSTFSAQLLYAFSALFEEDTFALLDVDICGPSIPRMLDSENESLHVSGSGWEPVWVSDNCCMVSAGLLLENPEEAIIWRGPEKNALVKKFLNGVNWPSPTRLLLVDTPPGTTDEHLALAQYLKPCFDDEGGRKLGALVVTTPHPLAVQDVRRQLDFCRKVKLRVFGIVENMAEFACPKCEKSTRIFDRDEKEGGALELAEEFAIPFLGSVPLDPRIGYCCDHGKSFLAMYPDTPAARVLREIVNKLAVLM